MLKKYNLKVKTNAKLETLKELGPKELEVHVKASPIEGKANKAICKLLAKHFKVAQRSIEITSGLKGKNKIVCIDDEND